MQRNIYSSLLTLVLSTFIQGVLFAQTTTPRIIHKRWEGGPLYTMAQYQGDLSKASFKEFNSGFGLLIRRHLNDNIALRSTLFMAKISGNDLNINNLKSRGFSFKSPITDINVMAEYDILGKRRYRNEYFNKIISPYLALGTGVSFVNPKTDYNLAENQANKSRIEADMNTKTKTVLPNLAYGFGLKIDVNNGWALNIDISKRVTFSDRVDGVSMSANSKKNDTYCFNSVGLIYRFRQKNDKDRDGIVDSEDFCPYKYGNAQLGGCPDRDGDLVPDKDDLCPNAFGDRNLSGCPSEQTIKDAKTKVVKD